MNGDEGCLCKGKALFLVAGSKVFCHWVAFGICSNISKSVDGVAVLLRKQEDRMRCFATLTNYHMQKLVMDRAFEIQDDQHMFLLQCQLMFSE